MRNSTARSSIELEPIRDGMDWIQVPRIDKGLLLTGARPSISTHLAISVLSADDGLTSAKEVSWYRY